MKQKGKEDYLRTICTLYEKQNDKEVINEIKK